MISLLKIYLKQLTPHLLVMLVIACGQIAAGRMNQLFINSAIAPSALEVYLEEESQLALELIEGLKQTPEMTIYEIENFTKEDLKTKDIQGILFIPKNFEQNLIAGSHDLVELYVASGIQDTTTVKETIATQLIQLKAQNLLEETLAIDDLALKKDGDEDTAKEMMLNIEYVSGERTASLGTTSLAMGILAVFLLFAVLYGNAFLPSFDTRRLSLYSIKSLIICQVSSLLALILLWLIEISFLFIGIFWLFKITLSMQEIFTLGLVLIYCLGLSLLLVNLGLRKIAAFLFVPWLLLNLTLGGGLWNVATNNRWLHPIFPVAMALSQETTLLICCILILFSVNSLLLFTNRKK